MFFPAARYVSLVRLALAELSPTVEPYLPDGSAIYTFGSGPLRVFLMAGTHGLTEPSGPFALLELLDSFPFSLSRYSFMVVPLLNSDGWDNDQRNWHGQDLNRAFGLPSAPPFLTEVAQKMVAFQPHLFIDLHEDDPQDGRPYLWHFTEQAGPRHFEQEAARANHAAVVDWDEMTGEWAGSSEVFARQHGVKLCLTVEANAQASLEDRVAWDKRVIGWALENASQWASV